MTLPQSFDDLVKVAVSKQLYGKLIDQLNKDLIYANIDVRFDRDVLPESLKLLLQEIVFKLINEKFSDYLNVLYIVDVSENEVRKLEGNDTFQLSKEVTFLILKREWQKVWYKHQFS